MSAASSYTPARKDHRIILHADYDAFYCAVFEAENPALKAIPFAVQQKQIIVTCNYEARRRGLHKLQLISEAKQVCPEVVIILGEQLDRFRDASKVLYKYLESFTWNKKVERLGFDEVFLDVSDIISYNEALLNPNDPENAFFQLSRDDPTIGFSFNATKVAGYQYHESTAELSPEDIDLTIRLILGSHVAQHIRHRLEEEKGYTSTFGISTSKMLSKLVGNVHKPKAQTTLMPPYESVPGVAGEDFQACLIADSKEMKSNVTVFIDSHDIGKIPGIGFKMSQKIRNHILSRPANFNEGLIYGETKESISVGDVRLYPGMGPEPLEKLLGGSGAERGIGVKVWNLINGVDDTEVMELKKIPTQISIEDSYVYLDTFQQVFRELRMLGTTLLRRMHTDLLEDNEETPLANQTESLDPINRKRWIAHPKTIRLTTRPRLQQNPDGTRTRSFKRISKSGPLPNFVFNLREGIDALVEKLVQETLIPMFHRLHPEKQGWNLSLMNIGVTNMLETASEDGAGGGRDIGRMFRHQNQVLKDWKVEDRDVPPDFAATEHNYSVEEKTVPSKESSEKHQAEPSAGSETMYPDSTHSRDPVEAVVDNDAQWYGDEDADMDLDRCFTCGAVMPAFAMAAHERYHALGGS